MKNIPEQELIQCVKKGMSQSDIADKFSVSQPTISVRIKKLKEKGKLPKDFKFKSGPRVKNIPEQELIECIEQGVPRNEIASKFSVSGVTIDDRIRKLKESGKIPNDFKFKIGIKNPSKKQLIIKYRRIGLPLEEIGKRLGGVSKQAVQQIVGKQTEEEKQAVERAIRIRAQIKQRLQLQQDEEFIEEKLRTQYEEIDLQLIKDIIEDIKQSGEIFIFLPEHELKECLKRGMTLEQIATQFQSTVIRIRSAIKVLKEDTPDEKLLRENLKEEEVQEGLRNTSQRELANKYHVYYQTIGRYKRKLVEQGKIANGEIIREKNAPKMLNLTEEELELCALGSISAIELAGKYNTTTSTIYRHIRKSRQLDILKQIKKAIRSSTPRQTIELIDQALQGAVSEELKSKLQEMKQAIEQKRGENSTLEGQVQVSGENSFPETPEDR